MTETLRRGEVGGRPAGAERTGAAGGAGADGSARSLKGAEGLRGHMDPRRSAVTGGEVSREGRHKS